MRPILYKTAVLLLIAVGQSSGLAVEDATSPSHHFSESPFAPDPASVERYGPAVRRYLRAAVPADAADELAQQFFVDLLAGKYRHAEPTRGRFRDYLKTSLFRRVLARDRTDAGARLKLAQALRALNRGAEAEAELREYERLKQEAGRAAADGAGGPR